MFYLFQTKDIYTFVSNTHDIIFLYPETWDTFSVILALLIHFGLHNTNPTDLMLSSYKYSTRKGIVCSAQLFADAVIHSVTATLVKLQLLKSLKEEHKTSRIVNFCRKNEPPHDKTKKMTVRPAKTRFSLSICPV